MVFAEDKVTIVSRVLLVALTTGWFRPGKPFIRLQQRSWAQGQGQGYGLRRLITTSPGSDAGSKQAC
jgi:hypothetical protein